MLQCCLTRAVKASAAHLIRLSKTLLFRALQMCLVFTNTLLCLFDGIKMFIGYLPGM